VRKGPQFRLLFVCFLVVCALPAKAEPATVQDTPSQKLDRQFQSAVAQYNAGRFAEAAGVKTLVLSHFMPAEDAASEQM